MSADSKLANKYGAGKTKTAQIVKDKENKSSVLKEPTVYSLCFEEIILGWFFTILFMLLRLYPPVMRK